MEESRGLEETRGPTGDDLSASLVYPVSAECLPEPLTRTGKYTVRFARNPAELEQLQRLRFEVFNLELGEGLAESFQTGRDEDCFDPVCHHLLVIENGGGTIVGTYRIQTGAMARAHRGFYSVEEFNLDHLPDDVMRDAVEVGRACVARDYRSRQVLFMLWRGLAAYMSKNAKRYLFGCCSLTSQDPVEGRRVMEYLAREGHLHPRFGVKPQTGWECYDELRPPGIPASEEKVDLPQLFRIYLRYGAKVCGPPAIDPRFKTIDYLVVLDVQDLDPGSYALFFKQ